MFVPGHATRVGGPGHTRSRHVALQCWRL
jgi:hypothetical protein